MGNVIERTLIFLAIIILGYILKTKGIIGLRGRGFLSNLVFKLTLPATIIYGFGDFHPVPELFLLSIFGFVGNWFMIGLGLLLTREQTREAKIFYVLNISGYNIGCFSMPFAQAIFGPAGIVATCMFDLGNSIMSTGGTYTFAKSLYPVEKDAARPTLKVVLKNLVSSVPFDVYTTMMVLALFGVAVPKPLLTVLKPFASINGYLSMLLLGLFLRLTTDKVKLKTISHLLVFKYLIAITCALSSFFLLPFAKELREVLFLVFLSPIPIICTIFTDNLGGNAELAGLANSVSIIISISLMMLGIFCLFN